MNQKIVEAIQNKTRLRVTYNGATRIVEPHAYGLDKNGALKLRAYQIADDASSADLEGWRLFNEASIIEVQETNVAFEPNEGYKRDDKAIDDIIAQL